MDNVFIDISAFRNISNYTNSSNKLQPNRVTNLLKCDKWKEGWWQSVHTSLSYCMKWGKISHWFKGNNNAVYSLWYNTQGCDLSDGNIVTLPPKYLSTKSFFQDQEKCVTIFSNSIENLSDRENHCPVYACKYTCMYVLHYYVHQSECVTLWFILYLRLQISYVSCTIY